MDGSQAKCCWKLVGNWSRYKSQRRFSQAFISADTGVRAADILMDSVEIAEWQVLSDSVWLNVVWSLQRRWLIRRPLKDTKVWCHHPPVFSHYISQSAWLRLWCNSSQFLHRTLIIIAQQHTLSLSFHSRLFCIQTLPVLKTFQPKNLEYKEK